MLLSRYSNIDFVLNMNIEDGIGLVNKAFEKINEEKLYDRWILHYQADMKFEDFKNKLMGNTIKNNKTKEEILEDVDKILKISKSTR